jgi:hypothetical protein
MTHSHAGVDCTSTSACVLELSSMVHDSTNMGRTSHQPEVNISTRAQRVCVCVALLLQVGSSEGADRTFERVHVYLPLEVPSARTIRRLAAFHGEAQRCHMAETQVEGSMVLPYRHMTFEAFECSGRCKGLHVGLKLLLADAACFRARVNVCVAAAACQLTSLRPVLGVVMCQPTVARQQRP